MKVKLFNKKVFSIILSVIMLISVIPVGTITASAATSGYYFYRVSNGKATITNPARPISGDITIPSELDGYPVTSIGYMAFEGCFALTSVTIPNSVTSIGDSAFEDCIKLTSITIPNSVTSIGNDAFEYCSSLTSITIPNSVKSIGGYAFSGCESLPRITIPNSVTSIGVGTFLNCESLTSVTIPDSVTSISVSAFYGCCSLTSMVVDKNNTTYDSRNGCNAIIETKTNELIAGCKNTVIPNSVTSIGGNAFFKCSSLTSITIPNSVTSIDYEAFSGCSSLTSITIPGSVTSIYGSAFWSCESLTSIIVDKNNTTYDSRNGCNAIIETKTNELIAGCKNTVIPNSVTSIDYYAFRYCSSLTSITIPNSVTSIGDGAFEECSSLTSVTIGNCVTSIGDWAFQYCSSLTSVTIPNSVTRIGYQAFDGCNSLTSITIINPKCLINYNKYTIPNKAVIKGYRGSTAESYAKEYGRKFVVIGTAADGEYLTPGQICFSIKNKEAWLTGSAAGVSSGELKSNLPDVTAKYNSTSNKFSNSFVTSTSSIGNGISFTKSGYKDFVIPSAITKSWGKKSRFTVYMDKDKGDNLPYISTVFARVSLSKGSNEYTEVQTGTVNVVSDEKYDVVISANLKGANTGTYYLSQDEKHRVSSSTGVFSSAALYSKFTAGKKVYAFVVTSAGKTSEPVEVNLNKIEVDAATSALLSSTKMSFFGEDGKVKFSNNKLFEGAEMSLGFAEFPVGIKVDNTKVRISVGYNFFSSENTNDKSESGWNNFKKNCKSLNKSIEGATDKMRYFRNYMTASKFGHLSEKKSKKTFDGDFIGYIEGDISTGKLIITDVCGTLAAELALKITNNFTVGPVPVYTYVKAGAEASASAQGVIPMADRKVPMQWDATLSLSPYIKGGAGLGAKDVVSAGLYAKAKLPVSFAFKNKHLNVGLNGEIGVEAELFGLIDANAKLLDGSVTLINHYFDSSNKKMSVAQYNLEQKRMTQFTYSPASRDYADSTSDWLGAGNKKPGGSYSPEAISPDLDGNTLQASVYKKSDAQIVKFGNKMMMAWIEDPGSPVRDTYNRLRLVYSVYDPAKGTWSTPKAVEDNGTIDGSPSLASDGTNVYVAWQDVKCTVSSADEETVSKIVSQSEIKLAKYNPATDVFGTATSVTNNSTYDYEPSLSVSGGNPVLYWANNTSNDMTLSGRNKLMKYTTGGVQTVRSGLNYITSIDSTGSEVSYSMDTDGDISTSEDIAIYTGSTRISFPADSATAQSAALNPTYGVLNGVQTLFYTDAVGMYYVQGGQVKSVFSSTRNVSGDINVVTFGGSTNLVWSEFTEKGSELFTCEYMGDGWTEPVQLTSYDAAVSGVSMIDFNNQIYGVFNKTQRNPVTEGDNTYYESGSTDLCYISTAGFTDIEVSLPIIDEGTFTPGNNALIPVVITNSGTKTVNEISLCLSDTLGTSSSVSKSVTISPGETVTVGMTYAVPSEFGKTTLTVTGNTDNDSNAENNTASYNIGKCDLSWDDISVEKVGNIYSVTGILTNLNSVPAREVSVNIYPGSEGSENFEEITVGTLAAGQSYEVNFVIHSDSVDFTDDLYPVYFKAKTTTSESLAENNSAIVNIVKGSHDHEYVPVVTAPTCTAQGYTTYSCSVCGDTYVSDYTDVAAHKYNGVVTREPTSTQPGVITYTCSVCGDTYTEDIPATSVSYTYSVSDGEAEITGYEGSISGDITIPSELGGYPVTSIGDEAFYRCSSLTSITIPNSVTSIGEGAFWFCSSLTSVTIPGSVTSIGESAFDSCDSLTSVTIGNGVAIIGDYAFYGCIGLTSVTIPNSVTSIGEGAFWFCSSLTSVTIPSSVTSIGDYAFYDCSSLTSVTIPSSVTSIGDWAFFLCSSLTDVYYGGYIVNWKKIRIGEGNENLLKSKIHYKSHSNHTYKTTVTKATTTKSGSIVKTCTVCGAKTTTPVYYPKTFKLSTTSYTYDGKVKKPAVTVKDSAGKTISSANYTVTYASGRKYVGKYAVKVTFKGSYYSGSKMLYFNINPRNTSISKLTSGRKSFKVYLRKYTTQTTGYQIQYSTSSKFTGAKTVTVSNKTTAKTISKLYGGKRYYVRCRTYKKVGNTNFFSSWSGAKAVTTKR